MSAYTPLEVIKLKAKAAARSQKSHLGAALQAISQENGFNNYHELKAVHARNPNEKRIMRAAFGVLKFEDVVELADIRDDLESLVEDAMNGETASTNASDFSVEDVEIDSEQTTYDPSKGKLELFGYMEYSGYQDQDRPFAGSIFYLDVKLTLVARGNGWSFDEMDGLTIMAVETDQDMDHASEMDDRYQMYLDEQK